MGCGVLAYCKCGYEEEFMIGGGMLNFHELCLFPALCKQCDVIVEINMLDNPIKCEECESLDIIPYDRKELIKAKGKKVVAGWNISEEQERDLILTDGLYYCPSCKQFALTFKDSGMMWD